jgi:hypothetical protein
MYSIKQNTRNCQSQEEEKIANGGQNQEKNGHSNGIGALIDGGKSE